MSGMSEPMAPTLNKVLRAWRDASDLRERQAEDVAYLLIYLGDALLLPLEDRFLNRDAMASKARAWGWGTVIVRGERVTARPGISRQVRGNPPRIESLRIRRCCQRCRKSALVWWTANDHWLKLPPDWRLAILCVACWRVLISTGS